MLSRLRVKPRLSYYIRCVSDKPPAKDGELPNTEPEKPKDDKNFKSSTEKIQNLLKSMLEKPVISENEYRDKFTTAPERKRKQSDIIHAKTEKIEENITKAAGEVAKAIGGNVKQTEAELLSKVLGKINQTSTSLSDLIVGMKVDRSRESDDTLKIETRGQQVKRIVGKSSRDTRYGQRQQERAEQRKQHSLPKVTTVDIFNGEPLGIFTPREANYGTKLDVWEQLNQRELALATSQPPANYFQKMIMWTEQGKVWKFPIDNEQGIEEEQNVHFSEHIFLDQHLEGWCPTRGPIRHFMELVCVGLSKNAFYTVQEKKDHIMWYKEYFESKKDLLNEIGAWDQPQQVTEAST
ncbi:28S ribosomal protein S31, mitochondrial [Aricia agestis]|uniref:28S ribosomal protein S31, mitochondrial n=1 Tax=Aricia agestis TaxID=91739 RepID=UPI001C20288D|nr:28S ribosomal protein S31, mitochondrial [Aricia agestis]XP_041975838.1 28S ribosomal protein S31, mitochondrial [Aricia agestis]